MKCLVKSTSRPVSAKAFGAARPGRCTLAIAASVRIWGSDNAATQPNGNCSSSGSNSRRSVLLGTLAGSALLLQAGSAPRSASATPLEDVARGVLRPDVAIQDAVVALMDARSTLKEIQGIAATSSDSQERFRARAFWPAYAKRLRAVAEAAPVVAGLVIGGDKEATLSQIYGGTGSGDAAITDAVYMGLGRVLTISGRTIRPEAQASPEPAAQAEAAISAFLQKVPEPLLAAAQEFRVARAKAAGQL